MAGTPRLPTPSLPYALRQVVGRYPVTLFTSKDCAPCDEGRTLLRSRGIPFTEKTVTRFETPKRSSAWRTTLALPLLTLGGQQIKGYSSGEWTQYLNARRAIPQPVACRLPLAPSRPLIL